VIADRVTVLNCSEQVVLGLVVVGRRGLPAIDVVGDLVGLIRVTNRQIDEVAAARRREAQELVRVAERIVRRVGIGRIESAIARFIARGDDERALPDVRVICDVRIDGEKRARVELRDKARRSAAVARVHVDDRREPLAVLGRIRALERLDGGDIVGIELRPDRPIEFLRNRYSVDDVVDVAVVAVDVNDAVGAACGSWKLQQQSGQTAAGGRTAQLFAAQTHVRSRAGDRWPRRHGGPADLFEARQRDRDRGARRRHLDPQRGRTERAGHIDVVRSDGNAGEGEFALRVRLRAQGEIAAQSRYGSPGDGIPAGRNDS
jgi:hypothetical protein